MIYPFRTATLDMRPKTIAKFAQNGTSAKIETYLNARFDSNFELRPLTSETTTLSEDCKNTDTDVCMSSVEKKYSIIIKIKNRNTSTFYSNDDQTKYECKIYEQ